MSRALGNSCAAGRAEQRLAHGRKQSGIPRVSHGLAKGQTERRVPAVRCPRTGNERRPCDLLVDPPLRDSPTGAAAVLRPADPPPLPSHRRGIYDRGPCRSRAVASSGQSCSPYLRYLAARITRRVVAAPRWTCSDAGPSHVASWTRTTQKSPTTTWVCLELNRPVKVAASARQCSLPGSSAVTPLGFPPISSPLILGTSPSTLAMVLKSRRSSK